MYFSFQGIKNVRSDGSRNRVVGDCFQMKLQRPALMELAGGACVGAAGVEQEHY